MVTSVNIKAKSPWRSRSSSDIKLVLKEDSGLDIHDKTKNLVKGITASEANAAAQRLLNDHPSLAHLGPLLTPKTFVDNSYFVLGVLIGTDDFIQHFVEKKCQEIMEDIDKLDNIQVIRYQLLRFCQATRLQYLNGQIQLANQQVLQQQHVNHKIDNDLLKKGTCKAYKKWNLQDRVWVDMRLHESHNEGGFVVPNNTFSRHTAAYTTKARFVVFLGTFARPAQEVWLPGNNIQDPTTWSVPSLCTLKHLHETLLQDYDCTEQPVANQPKHLAACVSH